MTVSLRTMAQEGLDAWRAAAEAHYYDERIAAGDSPAFATAKVAESRKYFPDGRPAENQLVFDVLDDERVVGALWLGLIDPAVPNEWWVFDIEIDPSYRGRGVGRATMLQAEHEVRARGGDRLGLNVFGPNRVARSLYDSLGYEVVSTNMTKALTTD